MTAKKTTTKASEPAADDKALKAKLAEMEAERAAMEKQLKELSSKLEAESAERQKLAKAATKSTPVKGDLSRKDVSEIAGCTEDEVLSWREFGDHVSVVFERTIGSGKAQIQRTEKKTFDKAA